LCTVVDPPSASSDRIDLYMPGAHREEKEEGKEAAVIAKSGIGVGPRRRH
jgi:hypothetical protein